MHCRRKNQGHWNFVGNDGMIGGALEVTHPGPHGHPGQGVGIARYLPTYLPAPSPNPVFLRSWLWLERERCFVRELHTCGNLVQKFHSTLKKTRVFQVLDKEEIDKYQNVHELHFLKSHCALKKWSSFYKLCVES